MLPYICGLCAVLLIWRWWKWLQYEDPTEPPTIPGRLPLLGHALMIQGDSVHMYNYLVVKISALAEKMGGVVKVYIGPAKIYGTMDPEDSLTVLNESDHKMYFYDFLKPYVGNGIFTSDVPTWKKNRKLLNPAFSQVVLDGFIEIFNTRAASLVEQFENELGKPFNHEPYLKVAGLETITATSFGFNSEECKEQQKTYSPLLHEIENVFNTRMKKIWYHFDFLYNFSSMKKRQDEIVKELHGFTDLVIKKKIANLNRSSLSSNSYSGKLKPFIDLLLDLSKDHPDMTDVQIRSETSTTIAAGHETNAVTLTYALTLLGSYPAVQEKAYQEILAVMGDSNRFVEKDDLSKLLYIEAVLKETLRLYPAGPLIARYLHKDIKLKNYTLKAGNNCIVSLHGSGRHAMWGADAHEFRPERWFEDTLPPAKYFAPFGLGRRSCIGKVYAMMMMKITLVHVLRNYVVSADVNKMVLKMDLFTSPHEGADIVLNRR